MQLSAVSVPGGPFQMPPAKTATLFEIVLSVSVSRAEVVDAAAPADAVLSEIVLSVTVIKPVFQMPPP